MSSYKDAPISLKHIDTKLKEFTNIINHVQMYNENEKTEYKALQGIMKNVEDNTVLQMMNGTLFVKQHIENIDDGKITVGDVQYPVVGNCCQIVAGANDALLLVLVNDGPTYAIAYKWGLYYGSKLLKWQDEYKLITYNNGDNDQVLNISTAEISYLEQTEKIFDCKYNEPRDSYYLLTSIDDNDTNDSDIPNPTKLLLIEIDSLNRNDEAHWNVIYSQSQFETIDPMTGETKIAYTNGIYYNLKFMIDDSIQLFKEKFPQGVIMCSGFTRSVSSTSATIETIIQTAAIIVRYNGAVVESVSVVAMDGYTTDLQHRIQESDVLLPDSYKVLKKPHKDFNYCLTEHGTTTYEDVEYECSRYIWMAVCEYGVSYTFIYIIKQLDGDGMSFTYTYWLNFVPEMEKFYTLVKSYNWNSVSYDPTLKEFVITYKQKEGDNIATACFRYELITPNAPIGYEMEGGYKFYISSTVLKSGLPFDAVASIYDPYRNNVFIVSKECDILERDGYTWTDKDSHFKKKSFEPLSVSTFGDKQYLLVKNLEDSNLYVYVLNYDMLNDWTQKVDMYYST